jgi:hypothetical protein
MDEKPSASVKAKGGELGPYTSYICVALVSASASAGIAFLVFVLAKWSNLSDGGLWALSAAVAAPAGMGIGVSYMIYRTSCARLEALSGYRPDTDSKPEYGIKE